LTANWDIGNYDLTFKSATGDGTIEGATMTQGGQTMYDANDTPGGELGGTFNSFTIDDSITVTGWVMGASTATTPGSDDNDKSLATTDWCETTQDYLKTSEVTAEVNNLETVCTDIETTEIFIGNASNAGVYAALSSEATMDNTGAVTLADSVTVTGWTMGASAGTTPSADDDDTSLATTAYVQTEQTAYASDTVTLTNKRITARVKTFSSDATPDVDSDDYDAVTITAQAAAITDVNMTGTPTNFQVIIFRIKDNSTVRAITWGSEFEDAGVALPTTTVESKLLTVGFIYNTVTSKWGCVAVGNET